jgi:hypothetical protein
MVLKQGSIIKGFFIHVFLRLIMSGDDKEVHDDHKEVVDQLDPEYEKLLQTDPSQGLTDEEAASRLAQFGPNGIFLFI